MENGQMPSVQPVSPVSGSVRQPQQMYTAEQVAKMMEPKKDIAGLIKTIVIIILSLVALTFVGLFVWMFVQYKDVQTDVDGQIEVAVAAAKDEQVMEDEAKFLEREKYPYKTFSGPADYGQLTFEYPKTWSVYIAKDASNGGDFEAYLNPGQVDAVSNDTINALRVTIQDKSFENVAAEYQKYIDRKDSNLTVETVTINGITANHYTGTIPNTDLSGYVVIFKIRDKTAVLRTDSTLFRGDFDKLLETITFNA